MTGLCECGCGGATQPARQTHLGKGWVKGQPHRFILGHIGYVQQAARLKRSICKHGHDLTKPNARDEKNCCRQCISDIRKRCYRKHVQKRAAMHRGNKLARKYGIDQAAFDALAVAQNGLCAVCRLPPRSKKPTLHVDHDHATGRVRGLLCHECNMAIGKMGDSTARLPECCRISRAACVACLPLVEHSRIIQSAPCSSACCAAHPSHAS